MAKVSFSRIEAWKADFPLRAGFAHNLASRKRAETILIALETNGGAPGLGQALPRSYLTGESLDSVLGDVRDRWLPFLERLEIAEGEGMNGVLSALDPLYGQADKERRLSSYAAVEMAVADAYARESGIPAVLGGNAATDRLPLVGVVSAGGVRAATWTVRIMRWLGYSRFKVKVGRDAERDERRLAAVRKTAGPGAWLAVDANQAWTLEEARARLPALSKYGVSVMEEPLRREEALPRNLRALEAEGGIAVMADESICTQADAAALLGDGGPSWWNLRFAKNGGFAGMRALGALAKANGIRVYQGILVGETSVLAAAARATMFGSGAECAEYGFPRFFLRGDPFRGGPGGFTGSMTPVSADTAGLGVGLLRDKLLRRGVLSWKADISS